MDSNESGDSTSRYTTHSNVRFSFALICLLASLLGNALVICSIYRFHQLRSCSNLIILNLSVVDVLFTLIVTPINAFYWSQDKESFEAAVCCITGVLSYLFSVVSIYTLVFISIERFMATNHPVRHRLVFNKRTIQIGISIIWIWSGFLCGLPFALSRYVYVKEYFHCMVDWSGSMTCTILFFICAYCLPVLTLTFCNIFVLRAARIGHRSRTSPSNSQNSNRASFFIVVIVVTFVICWTPYASGGIIVLLRNNSLPREFMSAAVLLTIGNASFNPVIYGVMNKNYREAFRKILCPRNSHVRPI
ncbi:somatostatin receptor type 4-like [Dendronephthya gigantea]|uniref:somatostatin receptor type 4-like n=1 Tax=Dendronephthya gigantea TaxID=151771 RepID=UPI001069877B|nr:somatostatin receptor type 4-like [Dendronephthya gigantea]